MAWSAERTRRALPAQCAHVRPLSAATYIERSIAKGWSFCVGGLSATSSAVRVPLISATLTSALPPRAKRAGRQGLQSIAIDAMFTTGRPSVSTGPIRKDEP